MLTHAFHLCDFALRAVAAVRLAATGAPLLVLRNHTAYTYQVGMKVWVRVADNAAPASAFHSSYPGTQGELGRLQADVAAARRAGDVLAAANAPADVQKAAERAHLEANMASAAALQSGAEWKRWLLTYVRQLAASEDEVRARQAACMPLLTGLRLLCFQAARLA